MLLDENRLPLRDTLPPETISLKSKVSKCEDIIAVTDDPCETFEDKEFIDIVDPVLICAYRIPREKGIMETYIMQTWIKMAVQDVISLPVSSILIAVDVQPKVIEQYDIFVIEANSSIKPKNGKNILDEEKEFSVIGCVDYNTNRGDYSVIAG
jgi:hypothetical protein